MTAQRSFLAGSHPCLTGRPSSGLQSAASRSQSLRDGAAGISQALSALAGAEGVPEEVKAQIAAVQQQADVFSEGISAYTYGVDDAAAGSAQLASKIPDLQEGISAVQDGAESLQGRTGFRKREHRRSGKALRIWTAAWENWHREAEN